MNMKLPMSDIIQSISKHMTYTFSRKWDDPTLHIIPMKLNIESIGYDISMEGNQKDYVIRGFKRATDEVQREYMISIDRDQYDVVLYWYPSVIDNYKYQGRSQPNPKEMRRKPYVVDAENVCDQIYLNCMDLLEEIPDIQILMSEDIFKSHVRWWVASYVLPYVLRNKKGDDDHE